ncbi:unnamed protein product [Ambrosiozyma monospora]|uniref:Unnamed protein product n=1 Tax=Ambrosiozyma monospora TaxID=43982 RepID=A0ACB5T1J8_AMBMO|nr:unnamed protein product [Ambrosiozyma monospora]
MRLIPRFICLMGIVNNVKEVYEFKKDYKFGDVLGVGASGTVRKAKHKKTKQQVAIKIISKKSLNRKQIKLVRNEVKILQQLNHPNIIKFNAVYESHDSFYIVTELAKGGELFNRIVEQRSFTETDAKGVILQLLDALNYLHRKNIVHRDIKPANIVFENDDDESKIKLVDFGIARKMDQTTKSNSNANGQKDGVATVDCSYAGTFLYSAPETYAGKYNHKADVWSVGVVCYMLLIGYHPFRSTDVDSFLKETKQPVTFTDPAWKDISREAKAFIKLSTYPDQKKRPTTEELCKHPWLTRDRSSDNEVNLVDSIKDHQTTLQKAVKMVLFKKRYQELRTILIEDGLSQSERDIYGESMLWTNTDTASTTPELGANTFERRRSSAKSIASIKNNLHHVPIQKSKALLRSAFFTLVLAAKANKKTVQNYQE